MPTKTSVKTFLKICGVLMSTAMLLTACSEEEPVEAPPLPATDSSIDVFTLPPEETIPAPVVNPGRLAVTPETINFGTTLVDKAVTRKVVVANSGDALVAINELRLAGNPSGINISDNCQEIGPLSGSASCEIELTLNRAEDGNVAADLILVHDGENSPLIISMKGEVLTPPSAPVAPPQISFQPRTSPLLDNALSLQQARRNGNLSLGGMTQTSVDFVLTDKDYGALAPFYSPTVSTLPIDRSRIITADRYIPAVLENTINSELAGGRVVGVVENHVYSGNRRNILIPAGSRAIGFYGGLGAGNTRLEVTWRRIIRPDGVGVAIEDPAADAMGRRGMIGDLDRRLFERFAIPLLVSTLASATDYFIADDKDQDVTVVLGEGQTLVRSEREEIVDDYIEDVSDIGQILLREAASVRPILTVPGGTRFYITPTRDIFFKSPEVITSVQSYQDELSGGAETVTAQSVGTTSNNTTAQNPAGQSPSSAYGGAPASASSGGNPYSSSYADSSYPQPAPGPYGDRPVYR